MQECYQRELGTAGRAMLCGFYFALGVEMCSDLKEFDLHARGVANLVESWKERHAAVRTVWKVEDLIDEWLRLAGTAKELFSYYCEHAQFPNSNAKFSYFVEIVEKAARCGADLEDLTCMFETEGYKVGRAEELRRDVDRLQGIVDEDRFATLAAFEGGALDDWD